MLDEYKRMVEISKMVGADERMESLWDQEVDYLASHQDETILFLSSECTADDLIWMSEIFAPLLDRTGSKELLLAVENAVKRHEKECAEFGVVEALNTAKLFMA